MEMLDKLVASKNANAGGFTLRQIFLATFDQRLHSSGGKVDTASLIKETYKEIVGIDTIEGTNFAARFAKEGVLNLPTGLDYRNLILKPGGSLDGRDLLKNFLGREPNQEAFLRS